ncbi:MAG: hypothetical protein AAFZ18_26875 [Myxococcota bacterium]
MKHLLDYAISATLSGLQELFKKLSGAEPSASHGAELDQERRDEDAFLQGQLDELDRQARVRRLAAPRGSTPTNPRVNGVLNGPFSGGPSNDEVLRILDIIGKPRDTWN